MIIKVALQCLQNLKMWVEMSLQVRMHKQNAANGIKSNFHNKRDKCPLAKMFPFEAILVSYSLQIMTLSYQNLNFTLTVEGMICEC